MTLKEKLQSRQPMVGTHVNLSDPCICDIIGRIGFDFIWVDCEHTYLSYKDVLTHISASATPVIVRVPQKDFNFTKKILEMGPAGLVFPMVHSAAEARELLSYTMYPPRGCRGYGPQRAVAYGLEDPLAYVDAWPDDLCRFLQIEHVDMIDELEEIAAMPEIDGFIFGPNDLSASLGHVGRGLCDEAQAQIRRAMKILNAAGKPAGVSLGSSDRALLQHYADMGMQILSTGCDMDSVRNGAVEALRNARAAHGEKQ